MSNAAVDELLMRLGPDKVKVGGEIPLRNWSDASGLEPASPLALVLPRTTEDVSAALAICHAHGQAVVTQGGLTGLAGGAHPGEGEVALSLERMVGVEELDRSSSTLTALAGTPLHLVQQAADDAGLMCGIDLGARGSCTIGGNVATNAGGNQVLRYGMARKNVLGLEAVLADGTVVRSLNKMMKNNAGYDWTQLFIGSEGTLGVVTRVVVALHPKPVGVQTAVLAVSSTSDAIAVLRGLERSLPAGLLVFEAMWREMYEIATTSIGVAAPIEQGHDLYLLVEAPGGAAAFEAALAGLYEDGLVLDAVIAKSQAERDGFWALRESVYEYDRHFSKGVGFDISIPLDRLSEAIDALRRDLPAAFRGVVWVAFGHIADSNIHLQIMPPDLTDFVRKAVEQLVYDHTKRLGGSVSAEHGIGRIKRSYLGMTRSAPELALMASVKRALDPKDILNPGRIL
ncbi:FAD-binding oxidoreductase [Arvimicrobium flavum]|uniref:FAD-binding oxidoreductase n=1 Tax=Arvimicrobium flavum TaxID=3393320 RepID=UPI00237C35B2|nr:FAD-binding oxidoreductase [Mesorhizobium shangrilense]